MLSRFERIMISASQVVFHGGMSDNLRDAVFALSSRYVCFPVGARAIIRDDSQPRCYAMLNSDAGIVREISSMFSVKKFNSSVSFEIGNYFDRSCISNRFTTHFLAESNVKSLELTILRPVNFKKLAFVQEFAIEANESGKFTDASECADFIRKLVDGDFDA